MTQHLLTARPDIFPDYTLDGMRAALTRHFEILSEVSVEDSQRTLFLLESTRTS
jgi:hypothetical protein